MKTQKMRFVLYFSFMILGVFTSCCTGAASKKTKKNISKTSLKQTSCTDGKKALGYIKDIIALGPRHAGTPGARKTVNYIIKQLENFGLSPRRLDFTAYTPHPEIKDVKMTNILVAIPGKNPGKKVLIGGHFDGKILEGINFKGANDGGSSTGLLLEIARCLSKNKPVEDVDIVFFDGEEALVKWGESDGLYGSKNFAAYLKSSNSHLSYSAAVIVDMIGDKNLKIFNETLSTKWVLNTLKSTASDLGFDSYFKGPRAAIEDDHIPLMKIGIPAAVLIDLRYGSHPGSNNYWHTEKDTLDKLSPLSIEIIGQTVLESIGRLVNRGNKSKN